MNIVAYGGMWWRLIAYGSLWWRIVAYGGLGLRIVEYGGLCIVACCGLLLHAVGWLILLVV